MKMLEMIPWVTRSSEPSHLLNSGRSLKFFLFMKQPTIEDGVNALLFDVKQHFTETCQNWEGSVRRSPRKAMVVAVAAGYLLHRLPVGSILATNVRLLAALVPPVVLAFGAAKVCEFLQEQARSHPGGTPMPLAPMASEESNLGASSPGF
jgi:hypothetical protein